jgi:signal transduction histidine kinase
MSERIRVFDWSRTPLGELGNWPASLRIAAEIMLNCGFPATLQWGTDLILLYNDAYIELIGPRHPLALGKPILQTFPEIEETYRPVVDRVCRGETVVLRNQLFRYVRNYAPADSWFELSYAPVYNEGGKCAGVLAIGLETTEKVHAENLLRASEDRHAFLLRLSDALRPLRDPVNIQDCTAHLLGERLHANRAHYAEIAGNEFVIRCDYVKGVRSIVGSLPIDAFGRSVSEALRNGKSFLIEDAGTHPGFSEVERQAFRAVNVAAFIGTPLLKDGRWVAALAVHSSSPRKWKPEDLELLEEVAERTWTAVERANAEIAHSESENHFRALVNATSDVLYRMNANWTELRRLRSGGSLSSTASPDRDWLQRYIHPDDHAMLLEAIRVAIDSKSAFQIEHRVLQVDGGVGWVYARAVPLINERGEITEWFGAASNITVRRRAEAALQESEKLAVVGRLATSIAHEINNPLEAVTNLLYLAELDAVSPQTKQYLQLAQSELNRVTHIASQTLRFHRQSTKASATNISEVLESVITLHAPRLRNAEISIESRYREHEPLVCFESEIRQVAANLIGNAIDAMSNSPHRRLILRVRAAHDSRTGRSGVRLTVADTGMGMSRATQHRIFEPFFTTKEVTGTGLGLWITKDLVRKHQGTLSVRTRRSPKNSGTTFAVFLPAKDS